MPQKVPPPPPIANQDQAFNRWLLELTAILNDGGGIDPSSVPGLANVIIQSAVNAAAIAVLQLLTANQGTNITALQADVATLQGDVVTINGALTTLGARAQVFTGASAPAAGLGSINDWYARVGGAAGSRIYIKTTATVWTPFPF